MNNIVGFDCQDKRDEPMAGEILRTLVDHYPGHDWFVLIRGGVVQIKNQEWSNEWGMSVYYSDIAHDAQARKVGVVRAAGEFLERANMRRGARTGKRIKRIEGMPEKAVQRARLLGA